MKVTVPNRARQRPCCPYRKIPIPFITEIPANGSRVKFSIENRTATKLCGRKKLCQFCGTALDAVIVFLGGPTAMEQRIYRQAPFHEECARYAVATCPYLRRTDDPQYALFCRRYDMVLANFPASELEDRNTAITAFVPKAIIRAEPVGKWAA